MTRTADAGELIEGQYADRPQLRPILDAVLALLPALGPATVQARKTIVSLVSPRRTFAVVRATTKDRADLGLRLDDAEPAAADTCMYTTTEDEAFILERRGRVVGERLLPARRVRWNRDRRLRRRRPARPARPLHRRGVPRAQELTPSLLMYMTTPSSPWGYAFKLSVIASAIA